MSVEFTFVAGAVETNLTANLQLPSSEIAVISTNGFPSAGRIIVGNGRDYIPIVDAPITVDGTEIALIKYTGVTSTSFTGCTIPSPTDANETAFADAAIRWPFDGTTFNSGAVVRYRIQGN